MVLQWSGSGGSGSSCWWGWSGSGGCVGVAR